MQKKTIQQVKTKDIRNSMKIFSIENQLVLTKCDFKINKVDTYIRNYASDKFEMYNKDIDYLFHDKEKIITEHFEVSQTYTITMFVKKESLITLDYDLKYNQYSSIVHIIISPSSIIPCSLYKASQIYEALLDEVIKIKAKNNIIINLFNEQMIKQLETFIKYIYKNKFTTKIKLPIFVGIEPTISRASNIIYLYKERKNNLSIVEVQVDETLIEYTKTIFSKNGFNAFGKTITSDNSLNDGLNAKIDDETIKIIDDDDKKLYISKIKGFVNFKNNYLSVDNKIKIDHISSTQKAVSETEHNNIEVYISQNNKNEDDVGEGVELTSETIHITGHVGAKSILHSYDLRVDGATHHSSQQHSHTAYINRHKGKLTCHEANITVLEGGEVHASNVNIGTTLGGSIYAQNVNISLVKHNLKVYASQSINIKQIVGEDNLLKINYNDVPIIIKHLNIFKEEIVNLKYKLQQAKKHTPADIKNIRDQIKKIQQKQLNIKESTLNAKITIEKKLTGLNTIIFTLDKNNEIIYKTQATSYKPFYIELIDNQIILHPVEKKAILNS